MLDVQKEALHYRSLVRFYVQLRKVLPAQNRLERSLKSILNERKRWYSSKDVISEDFKEFFH